MLNVFKKGSSNIELHEIKYEELKKPQINTILELNIIDRMIIRKKKDICEILISRNLTTKDKLVFNVSVELKTYRVLVDETINMEDIKEYIIENKDSELQSEMTQISLLITQNTVLSPLRGVVTPSIFDGEVYIER